MTASSDRCARSTKQYCLGPSDDRPLMMKSPNFTIRLLLSIFGILTIYPHIFSKICSYSSRGFAEICRPHPRSLVAAADSAGKVSKIPGSSLGGYASNEYSKITEAAAPFLKDVLHNITAVRSTGRAFSARIYDPDAKDDNVKFESQVAVQYANSTVRKYVFWGVKSEGGEIVRKNDVEDKQAEYFVDLCGISKAFIGIVNWEIQCIGDSNSCNGHKIAPKKPWLKKRKVFCAKGFPLAVVEMETKVPDTELGSILQIVGDGKYALPPDDDASEDTETFLQSWRNVAPDDCISLEATVDKAAILLQGGRVLSWDSKRGVSVDYVKKLVANNIGFAALLVSRKVNCWGDNRCADIPAAIHLKEKSDQVADVVAFNECFVAITTEGAVRTWGGGEVHYCSEAGAHNDRQYTSFMDVKEHLSKGVVRVVGNDKSLVAIRSAEYDNEVIVWGHKDSGGSKIPKPNENWSELDIRWGVPDTLVATATAYAMQRTDKRIVSWPNPQTGDAGTALNGGAKDIKASRDTFVVLTENDELVVFPGDLSGVYTFGAADPYFKLNAMPMRLTSTAEGVVVVFGHDCIFSEWSSWSKCSKECGGGIQKRTREMEEYPRNGKCGSSTETQACNAQKCVAKKKEEPQTPFLESTTFLVLSISGGAGLVLVAGGIYVVRKRQRAQRGGHL